MARDASAKQAEMSPDQVLAELRAQPGRNGFQRHLDAEHWVTFVDRGPNLLVSFEKLEDSLTTGDNGLPVGMDFVDEKNWSLLHFSAAADSWFRRDAIYRFVDELIDDAFFENFDQVTFYGAGRCGYAACAFSVAAPGARVLAIAPQATLESDRAGWDPRFPDARRMDWDDRYGYAPQMLEGASAAFVLFDPHMSFDAVHASLFQGSNVTRLKCRHFNGMIEIALREMDLLHQVIEMVADGTMTPQLFYRLLRSRRSNARYLRRLLFHTDGRKSPLRTAVLCIHVLDRMNGPAFRKRLAASMAAMTEAGTLPDWLRHR